MAENLIDMESPLNEEEQLLLLELSELSSESGQRFFSRRESESELRFLGQVETILAIAQKPPALHDIEE